jgi:hypothetical protein
VKLRRQIAATDAEIDRLVYELYGLTEEEIAVVEGIRRRYHGARRAATTSLTDSHSWVQYPHQQTLDFEKGGVHGKERTLLRN